MGRRRLVDLVGSERYVHGVRLLAALLVALVFAAPAAAGTSVKVPVPAAGKVRVEMLTIKASATPKLTVTNLSALGSGFHGAYAVGMRKKAPGQYVAFLVMFSSSAPSVGTMSLQISNGTAAGAPIDDTENCSALRALGYQEGSWMLLLESLAYGPLKHGDSPPKTEVKNDASYQARSVPGCK